MHDTVYTVIEQDSESVLIRHVLFERIDTDKAGCWPWGSKGGSRGRSHLPSRESPESSGTAQPTDDSEVPSQQELKNALEKGSDDDKIKTLKRILILMLNGDPMPGLLMHVIRFIMPSKNKTLKKLLLVYWEVCPKTNPDGKLKQEMVLVWYVTVFFVVDVCCPSKRAE